MEAKIKAKELVYWYENLLEPFIKDKELLRSKAKQCALICVDEIIKFTIEKQNESMYFEMDLKYWQEVKQEIEA